MANMPNYYGNPYINYGMPNYSGFNPQAVPQQTTMIQQPTSLPQPTFGQSNIPMIAGKIVESVEMSKVQEVTPGSYGVFPLADFSKVVIKAYDKDGNLQYFTYDLEKQNDVPKEDPYSDKLSEIYTYLGKLEKKIDGIKIPSATSTTRKKKVVEEVDDYE